jgi:hypothetical protein
MPWIHINTNQFEIDKNKTKSHDMTFKHFKYLKERDKKVHKMNNNVVKVWSNLSYVMCHTFIKKQSQMPPPITFKSSYDDLALSNSQVKNED